MQSGEATQALGDLIADVAGLDLREDEGVGVASHLGAGGTAGPPRGRRQRQTVISPPMASSGQRPWPSQAFSPCPRPLPLAGTLGGVAQKAILGSMPKVAAVLAHSREHGLHQSVRYRGRSDGAVAHAQALVHAVLLRCRIKQELTLLLLSGLGLDELQGRRTVSAVEQVAPSVQAIPSPSSYPAWCEVVALIRLLRHFGVILPLRSSTIFHHAGVHAFVGGGVHDADPHRQTRPWRQRPDLRPRPTRMGVRKPSFFRRSVASRMRASEPR